jgi:hypothetical protein
LITGQWRWLANTTRTGPRDGGSLDDDATMVGANDIVRRMPHAAGLLQAPCVVCNIAIPAAMTLETVPAAPVIAVADDNAAAGTADGKAEADIAGCGGRSRSRKPAVATTRAARALRRKVFIDCSPDVAALDALSGVPDEASTGSRSPGVPID